MSDLATRVRAKFPGAYDDLSDADLEKAVLAKHPEYADLASKPEPAAATEPAKSPSLLDRANTVMDSDPALVTVKKLAGFAKDHPVATGASIGGALATGGTSIPAQLALSALGAAGGAGYGLLAKGAQSGDYGTPGGNAATMAKEGAAGAAGQGIGAGVGKILSVGGKLVYKTALRPSMGLQREFGDVAATGLREAAPVSQGGVERIGGKLQESAGKARQMVADAEKAGASPIPTKEVASEFGDVFKQGRNQAQLGRPDPRPSVWQRLSAFDAKNPNGIPLGKAQDLKSEAQDLATRAYRAQDLGHPITDLSAASDKAMARGLRKGIEARVPGVGPVNARTQELIGLQRALEDATRRNVPGVGSLRSLLGDFVPSVASGVGIGASRVGSSRVLPASFKTALIAALSGQQE